MDQSDMESHRYPAGWSAFLNEICEPTNDRVTICMAPCNNSQALGGLFVKAGQWLANMAATPLVWDPVLLRFGPRCAGWCSMADEVWTDHLKKLQDCAPKDTDTYVKAMLEAGATHFWWCQLLVNSQKAEFGKNFKAPAACNPLFLAMKATLNARNARTFSLNLSLIQLLRPASHRCLMHLSMSFVKCWQETQEDNNAWKLLLIESH